MDAPETDTGAPGRGARQRERRCIATGETRGEADLVRFVLSPDGVVTPDVAARLPGRGAWASADRAAVERAVKKGLFSRAFQTRASAPDDLAGQVEALLEARALSALGLARRAGKLAAGFDAARLALKARERPAWRIEASDAARDGREKLDRLAEAVHPGLPVAGCFDAETLGRTLGRSGLIHAVLAEGAEARRFTQALHRLAGFRPLDGSRADGAGDAGVEEG